MVRVPASLLEHCCSPQALIGQLSPDCRAPGTFQSAVDGMWALGRTEFSLVAVWTGGWA